jgi:3-hydroxyisobutyrate dehydrogenase-like beta-hydroxyacid dehydrogenase
MTERHVGFIGVGRMGNHMAGRLLEAGYRVTVYDTNETAMARLVQRGAERADSAAAVASAAQTVLASLPTPDIVRAVALGADGVIAGTKVKTFVDLSTTGPRVAAAVAAVLAAKGIAAIDAPVSGGPSGAASRKMAIWVGGDKAAYDRHKAVLDAMGDRAAYIGPIGTATVAKLVHNMSGYAITCALAETFTMGVKAGMDPVALWEAVRQGVGGRRFTFDGLLDQFLPGKYDPPNFALKLATKDVKLATELGRELGVPMRICNLAYAEMREACNRGWEARDSRSVMLLEQDVQASR